MTTTNQAESFNFEEALSELHTLVEQMELGKLSLEKSLITFERGIQLTKLCQNALQQAEQKVQILLLEGSAETLSDFKHQADEP